MRLSHCNTPRKLRHREQHQQELSSGIPRLAADKRNALVRDDIFRFPTDKRAVDAFDRKRLVIIAVDYRLILTVPGSYFLLNLAQGFASFFC